MEIIERVLRSAPAASLLPLAAELTRRGSSDARRLTMAAPGAARAALRGAHDQILGRRANELSATVGAALGAGGDGDFDQRRQALLEIEAKRDADDRREFPAARQFGGDVVATGEFFGRSVSPFASLDPNNAARRHELLTNRPVAHPGFGESLIPFWGSGKEAVADYQDEDYLGAIANGALMAADGFGWGLASKTAGKAGVKLVGKPLSSAYRNVRGRMVRRGHVKPGEVVHHWAIPQRWKWVPEEIRNSPLNLQPMSPVAHKRHHGRALQEGLPKYTFIEGLQSGVPEWASTMAGVDAAKGIMATDRYVEEYLNKNADKANPQRQR